MGGLSARGIHGGARARGREGVGVSVRGDALSSACVCVRPAALCPCVDLGPGLVLLGPVLGRAELCFDDL